MALIRCRECGKKISEFCSACPKCGCPVERHSNETIDKTASQPSAESPLEPEKTELNYSQKKNQRTIRIISAIILVVVGFGIIYSGFYFSDEIKDAVYFDWYIDALENDTVYDAFAEYANQTDNPYGKNLALFAGFTNELNEFKEYMLKDKLSGKVLQKELPFYIGGIGCFALAGYFLISLKKYPLVKRNQTQNPQDNP